MNPPQPGECSWCGGSPRATHPRRTTSEPLCFLHCDGCHRSESGRGLDDAIGRWNASQALELARQMRRAHSSPLPRPVPRRL